MLPMIWLFGQWGLESLVVIPILINVIGDGLAEPVGVRFGKYRYKTKALFTDIYISIDRVRENAKTHGESFKRELHRVMIHGILHLLGYDDHETEDIKQMRKAEEYALEQLM